MGLTTTLALAGLFLALALICGWRGALPPDLNRGPRLIPWRFLMMLSGAALVFLLVHLASLMGLSRQG